MLGAAVSSKLYFRLAAPSTPITFGDVLFFVPIVTVYEDDETIIIRFVSVKQLAEELIYRSHLGDYPDSQASRSNLLRAVQMFVVRREQLSFDNGKLVTVTSVTFTRPKRCVYGQPLPSPH